MDFTELDEAKKATGGKKGKPAKKKAKIESSSDQAGGGGGDNTITAESSEIEAANATLSSDLRTGRWTQEETVHCDSLIHQFMTGKLPLQDGLKLNEFLAGMLKSKQSRLTKKMKNAKLSSKTFKRSIGFLCEEMEARAFSDAETAFFNSITNLLERAEIKFHIAKEWREMFSTYCVSHGQSLNVDKWLASVEEMDRRSQRAKEMERVKRREMMMGHALRQDSLNPDRGVTISSTSAVNNSVGSNEAPNNAATTNVLSSSAVVSNDSIHDAVGYSSQSNFDANTTSNANVGMTSYQTTTNGSMVSSSPHNALALSSTDSSSELPSQNASSPFLQQIIDFVHRHHVPFEYVDVWVPSFVPDADDNTKEATSESQPKCRLCFAGSLIANQVILETSTARRAVPLSPEDKFNLSSFGDYSESFSFDVGCGLPGRVYHMGVPTWEQSVHNAPLNHFERVGGAQQWGIRTVMGIPVPSPNVGRVVVVLYSRYDRAKDHDMVIRLTEEFTRLMPSPKWKLVVDVGEIQAPVPQQNGSATNGADNDALTSEVINMFGEHMPSDPSNPGFSYLQGFMSLRLLLLRKARSDQEQDIVNTILSSYSSYKAGGRTRPDIALMLARDFLFLSQQPVQQIVQTGQGQMSNAQGMQQQQQHSFSTLGSNANQNHLMYQNQHQGNMNVAPAASMMASQNHQAAPVSQQHQQPQFIQQQQQQMQSSQEQEYYHMMGDIEPEPVNIPQHHQPQQEVIHAQSPLDAAVENVERMLSPENENPGSAIVYQT
eukprot:scaffold121622_cov79-Cyclotella_meneghiniana.AAC.1